MNTTTPPTNLRGVIATAIFSAVAFCGTAICTAADSPDALRVTVRYADLNLSTPQGASALYARIQAAADQVCRPFNRRELAFHKPLHSCVRKAIADAVAAVNKPALLDVYASHHRTSQPIIVAAGQAR
jgi:UrcA family protein